MDIRNGGLLDVVTPRLEGTTVKAGGRSVFRH